MSGRSVQPSSPQQETSVQQQGQQHNRWWQRCEQVAAFQQQRGRLPRTAAGRSSPFLVGEQGLGKWVVRQRQRYKAQKLSAERVAALETLPGFCWLEFARKPWEQQRQLVEAFYRQHGRLPRRIAEQSASFLPGEGPLGAWIMRQRSQGRGRMQPPLSAEHVAALDRTPGWSWGEFKIEPWESRCQQLQTFVRQHGRLPRYTAGKSSPFLHAEKGLGNWVRNQRQQYKARKLSAEQIAALEATPGWCWAEWSQQAWESRLQQDDWWEQRWEQRRRQLKVFVRQHKRMPRVRVTLKEPLLEGEQVLGLWRQRQRQKGTVGGPR
ncbi:hypothetical protein N2152v2_001338 [Parachlorella kessleri]